MTDLLAKLSEEITSLGDQIKTLKSSGGEKEMIDGLVKQLLSKKQEYADNNNGIGVDGKPFGGAEKKKKEGAGAGPPKQVRKSNSC